MLGAGRKWSDAPRAPRNVWGGNGGLAPMPLATSLSRAPCAGFYLSSSAFRCGRPTDALTTGFRHVTLTKHTA
jgi:hypothetical protein